MSCSNASSLLGPQACCFIRRLGLECFFCMATYSCITRLGQASPSSFRDGIGDGQLLSAGWEISSTSLARNAQAVDKIVLIKDRAEPKTSKPCLSSYRDGWDKPPAGCCAKTRSPTTERVSARSAFVPHLSGFLRPAHARVCRH
jgi:hypothetical protein